jgi:hypothetical protein
LVWARALSQLFVEFALAVGERLGDHDLHDRVKVAAFAAALGETTTT